MRSVLRQATREAHDRLDALAADLPVSSDRHYARFLRAQFAARSAMEAGFATIAPPQAGPPPVQTQLIVEDLAELGHMLPSALARPALSSAAHALGAAWAIAGSSLGNRAMLARRHKAGLTTAERFLSDQAMPDYFTSLLRVIENPANRAMENSAIEGAFITFRLFEAAFLAECMEIAA